MSLNEDMSAAERDFFASRGRNTDALLAENNDGVQRVTDETPVQSVPATEGDGRKAPLEQGAVPTTSHDESTSPHSTVDRTESPSVPLQEEDEPDQLNQPTKRVSWNKYQQEMVARKAAEEKAAAIEKERLSWIEERAAVNERLRLFNEALRDDQPQQVEEDPRPDPMQDAYAAMEWDRRRADRLEAELNQWRQQQGQVSEEQQLKNAYMQSMQSAATQYPILGPAYHYLIKHRSDELEISRPDLTPEQRQLFLHQEEAELARRELSQGRNPANLVYQLAKGRGFENWYAQQQNNQSPAPAGGGGAVANGANGTSPPAASAAPAPSNVPSAVQQVQAIAANQAASRSLSHGGGAPMPNIDSRWMATASDEDFAHVLNQLKMKRNKQSERDIFGH